MCVFNFVCANMFGQVEVLYQDSPIIYCPPSCPASVLLVHIVPDNVVSECICQGLKGQKIICIPDVKLPFQFNIYNLTTVTMLCSSSASFTRIGYLGVFACPHILHILVHLCRVTRFQDLSHTKKEKMWP